MRVIKLATIATIAALIFASAEVSACEPIFYTNDQDRLEDALGLVAKAKAAIDGVVVSGSFEVGSVATVRPTTVWFGPKQANYRIIRQTMCSDTFNEGDHVRILLFEERPAESGMESLKRSIFFWRWGAYEAEKSEFSWAMRFKQMKKAVQKRAASDAASTIQKLP